MKHTVIKIAIHPEGENPVYGERTLFVELTDEGGGQYLEISGGSAVQEGCLRIELEELEAVLLVARELMQEGAR